MKTKHPILLVLLCLTLFTSCSKSDDSNSGDSIIGTWKIDRLIIDGAADEISDCWRTSTFTFSSDGDYNEITKGLNFDDSCVTTGTKTATWTEGSAENYYSITFIGGAFDGTTIETQYHFTGNNELYIDYIPSGAKLYYKKQ